MILTGTHKGSVFYIKIFAIKKGQKCCDTCCPFLLAFAIAARSLWGCTLRK